MTYTPRPGDIGLTQIKGVVGILIRIGQFLIGDGFRNYEHAFMYVGNGEIVEGMPGGALLSKLSKYTDRSDEFTILWLPCPDEYRDQVASEARKLVGTPYSFLDYVSISLVRFGMWPITTMLRHYVEDSGHLICSALCDRAASRGGWKLFDDGRLPGDVTPGDLSKLANGEH